MDDRPKRAGSFLFDVDRFENDPVVLAMHPLARVHFCRMILRLWKAPEPGVVPDDDRVLKGMCEAGDLWPQIRDDVRLAFDCASRPGLLVQQGVVRTHREQTEWAERKSEAGRAAGLASARSRQASKKTQPSSNDRSTPVNEIQLVSVSVSEESKSTPLLAGASGGVAEEPGEESPREWADGFPAFWKAYPRKVSKQDAFKSYMKLKPRTQATYDLLFAGLEVWGREWAGKDATYVPYASTWLNERRYCDAER